MPKNGHGHPHPLTEELWTLLVRGRRVAWTVVATRLFQMGESMMSWQILVRLCRSGSTTQRGLAEAMGQHPAGVSRVLDDLEGAGLVRRRRDPHDRRKVRVQATAAGRARYAETWPAAIAAVESKFRVLSAAERRTLRTLLGKLVDADSSTRSDPARARLNLRA